MTIKELENKTGMTRANIRYYENEGLLHPRRLDNGYRDYSEEDARTLEKIKLLRQIGLDIDTIRKVQSEALTLEQALFTQLTRLEGDKVTLERAAEVCRELERSGVEYAALDPQPWLRQLELQAGPAPGVLPPAPAPRPERDDTPRACYCPWQRYFARMLDITLYSTVFDVLWLVLTRDRSIVLVTGILGWFIELIGLAFALAVEPLWLHFWGWTPGKWLFGLKVRDEKGEKLTLAQGFRRSGGIIWEGYGLNIPFYGLWRFWKCRELGLDGRDCGWDAEEGYRYTKEERRVHPAAAFALVALAAVAALFMGLKHTETPPNRGALTMEEYAENYNYYFRQLVDQNSTTLPRLSENCRWLEPETPLDTAVISFDDTAVWAEPKITFTGGYVTAVTLRMESGDWIVSTGARELFALLALSGSVDGTDLFHYDLAGWVKTAEETLSPWEDAELDYRGLHISQQVDYSGYQAASDGMLFSENENTPCHCEKTVTISVIDKNGVIEHPPGQAQAPD